MFSKLIHIASILISIFIVVTRSIFRIITVIVYSMMFKTIFSDTSRAGTVGPCKGLWRHGRLHNVHRATSATVRRHVKHGSLWASPDQGGVPAGAL